MNRSRKHKIRGGEFVKWLLFFSIFAHHFNPDCLADFPYPWCRVGSGSCSTLGSLSLLFSPIRFANGNCKYSENRANTIRFIVFLRICASARSNSLARHVCQRKGGRTEVAPGLLRITIINSRNWVGLKARAK